MSLSLEELRERHIALPGDLMLCPGCEAPLLRFTCHTFTGAEFLPAADRRPAPDDPERYSLYCADCSSGSTRTTGGGGPGIEHADHSAMYVRSGTWEGWRALSGE